jgi:hypothetical protein
MKGINLNALLLGEYYKLRKNIAYLMLIIFPCILIIGLTLHYAYDLAGSNTPGNHLQYLLGRRVFPFLSLFYPSLVAMSCSSLCSMEHKNANLQRLYSMPLRKSSLYFVKMTVIIEGIFTSLMIAWLLSMLAGLFLSSLFPNLAIQDYDIQRYILLYFVRLFIALVSIAFIQTMLSNLFSNYILVTGFAFFCTVFALIINKTWIIYLPYKTDRFIELFYSENGTLLDRYSVLYFTYMLIFGIVGYCIVQKIRIPKFMHIFASNFKRL